jgi:Pyruvate/2-oxoacid:ferredoxin oxidoreductase gamma subunit
VGFVDAHAVAGRVGLGRMVNTAILGAYCRFSGRLALDDLIATIRESVPAHVEPNIEAARLGYAEVIMPN